MEVGFKGFYLEHKIELTGAVFTTATKQAGCSANLYTADLRELPGEVSIRVPVNGAELSATFGRFTGVDAPIRQRQ